MTALAIGACAAAAAALSFPRLFEERALRREVLRVVSVLEQARLCAIRYSQEVTLDIAAAAITSTSHAALPCTGNSLHIAPNIEVGADSFPLRIAFYASGAASPAAFTLRSRNRRVRIKLSLRGRITTLWL